LKLIDATESAVHIDLYHILKYKGFKKIEEVLFSEDFSSLPLKRVKLEFLEELRSKVKKQKTSLEGKDLRKALRREYGRSIYSLWKNDKKQFREYLEGEVNDFLLLVEKLTFK